MGEPAQPTSETAPLLEGEDVTVPADAQEEVPATSDPEAMDGDLGAYGADGVGGGVG